MFGRDEIVDRLGAESWEQVGYEFDGNTLDEVLQVLDEMFPNDNNSLLAESIVAELS
jgi:hypothetical protein